MGTSLSLLLLVFLMGYTDLSMALVCYRCDNLNHGSTCDSIPATRHLRNYGEEEACLSYEDVNNQYLALQKDVDVEWYLSPVNGDHGLPVHLLLEDPYGGNASSLTLIHADRDLACLFVRSTFHHSVGIDPSDTPEELPHTVYFRKCVQLPSLDVYPICRQANIYKGQIEMCVCRTDKCNLKLIESPQLPMLPRSSEDIIVEDAPLDKDRAKNLANEHSYATSLHKTCSFVSISILILNFFQ